MQGSNQSMIIYRAYHGRAPEIYKALGIWEDWDGGQGPLWMRRMKCQGGFLL